MTELLATNFLPNCQNAFPQLGNTTEVRPEITTLNVFAAVQLVPCPKGKKPVRLPKAYLRTKTTRFLRRMCRPGALIGVFSDS